MKKTESKNAINKTENLPLSLITLILRIMHIYKPLWNLKKAQIVNKKGFPNEKKRIF